MDDIFNLVERFFQGALSLLYNTLYSVVTLLRHPVRGPLQLNMRRINDTTHQLGPSTLSFLVFFSVGGLIPFSRGGNVNPTSAKDLRSFAEIIQAISDKGFVAFFLVSIVFALVAASCIDLISRIVFWLFFKHHYIDKKNGIRRHITARRRRLIFSRFQYTVVLGLILQIFIGLVFSILLFYSSDDLVIFLIEAIIFVAIFSLASLFAVFCPCARMLRRHGWGKLTYLLPVALGTFSFFAWAAAAFVTAALLSRGDGVAFVDKAECSFSPSAATLCSFALYNGGDQDIILDSNSVTLSFFYTGNPGLNLQRKTNGDGKAGLESDVLKKSLVVVGKGRTEVLDLSPSGSDWQAWAQKADTTSISAYLFVSYSVQGDSKLDWKKLYSQSSHVTVPAQ